MNDFSFVNASLYVNRYSIHGTGFQIFGDSLPLMGRIDARLSGFKAASPGEDSCSIVFESAPSGDIALDIPDDAHIVCELTGGEALYCPSEDRLYCRMNDRISGFIDAESGAASFKFRTDDSDLLNVSHLILTLCIEEMLKRRGYYPLHAACLSRQGKSALFAGDSGCGKSTLTVALLQSDFDFMGDDTAFLSWRSSRDGSERRCHSFAFPDRLDLTDTTLNWFPRLRSNDGSADHPSAMKRSFSLRQISERPLTLESEPALLFFPRISENQRTILVPMKKSEAFLELAPNVWLTNRVVVQRHLEILNDLTQRCVCYRVETGRDFESLADLILDRFASV